MRPKRDYLRQKRTDSKPGRIVLRPERDDNRPQKAYLRPGGIDMKRETEKINYPCGNIDHHSSVLTTVDLV